MKRLLYKLRIYVLKGRIAASRRHGEAMAAKLRKATNFAETVRISENYEKSLGKTHSLEMNLEMLEQQQRNPSSRR